MTGHGSPPALGTENDRNQGQVVMVPISSLLAADSPRLAGENDEHARALAESETSFPPIIVNRSTMRVIDGMHRLRAAELRGEDVIEVKFFDGDDADTFALAVKMNISHGLPLSLADRTAAAARIIKSRPQWSDRVIASKTGLAAKTVAAIRRRSAEPQPNSRIGRDGRVRPLDTEQARQVASQLMTEKPGASLRDIARVAGISLGTAQDVRKRLRLTDDPALAGQHDEYSKNQNNQTKRGGRINQKGASRVIANDRFPILQNLREDPSFRFIDAGRILLHLLHSLALDGRDWERLIENIPSHCKPMVSAAARACADVWQEFAERLESY